MKDIESIPWIPYLATHYLEQLIKPDYSVFEYGSGGSTLFFMERAHTVISTDHDKEWHDKILPQVGSNVTCNLIPYSFPAIGNDKSNPLHYTSNPFAANFESYVKSIDKHNTFDLIFVDGRSRASCLMHASKKIKPGGWIVLDNMERSYYLENTKQFFEEWETVLFYGKGPYINWPWKTLFMRNPF